MRLLVCGGRYYADKERVWKLLDGIHAKYGVSVIIESRCPYGGADRLAQEWAEDRGVDNLGFPMVGWAGPARNTRMLDEGLPTHCLAFPGGNGTMDMVRKASLRLGVAQVHQVRP